MTNTNMTTRLQMKPIVSDTSLGEVKVSTSTTFCEMPITRTSVILKLQQIIIGSRAFESNGHGAGGVPDYTQARQSTQAAYTKRAA